MYALNIFEPYDKCDWISIKETTPKDEMQFAKLA